MSALVLALALAASQASAPRPPILERVPADLPHAAEGRWEGWSPADPVPDALRPDLVRATQAYLPPRDYVTALEALYHLLENEPDYPPALYQMGTVYFRLARYGDAAEAFERFLAVAPGEIRQTQGLGHCYYSLGRYERAREHYEKVIAAGAESPEARRGLGLARMRLGDLEGALSELRQVVAARPEHGDAWAWIARVLLDLGRPEEALEPARKGVQYDAFEPRPWFVLSQVLYELGQDDEGDEARARFEELNQIAQEIRALEARIDVEPGRWEARVRLVELWRQVGDRESVRTGLARLFALRPDDCDLRAWSLDVLTSVEDEEAARLSARAMEEACGDDARTWKRLELFYRDLGDIENQVRCGERYLRMGGQR